MRTITRLAICESGEPAVRILAAVGNLNHRNPAAPITSVLVYADAPQQPWFAREADAVLAVQGLDADGFAEQLVADGVDTVWPAAWPELPLTELVAACERAGLGIVGPSSEVIASLTDCDSLTRLAEAVGLTVAPEQLERAECRRLEVDVLRDAEGNVWSMGLRDVSICDGARLVLAEAPAPHLLGELEQRCRDAAGALMVEAAYVGAGVVGFLVRGEEVWLEGVDPDARPEHAMLEESTGASFLGLRLHIATGGAIDPQPPVEEGWAVEARLVARRTGLDEGTPIRVRLLEFPPGTGVRVDSSLREGDRVSPEVDPALATICAWGRDRHEAHRRLRRALDRTGVVLDNAVSNRSELTAILAREDLHETPATLGWYDAVVAAGGLRPAPDPLALLAAAIECYDADLTAVQGAFLASAKRGRPEHPESVGTHVHLAYAGSTYRLRVDRTSLSTYRVHDGVDLEATVEHLGPWERRLICGGRKHRVLAATQGAEFLVEVDGVLHSVTRVDGTPVRAGWPALVSAILVQPGQHVTEGDPVAVLESMKMVSTITAPFSGEVLSVDVVANAQVEREAPLFWLRAEEAPGVNRWLDTAPRNDAVHLSALATDSSDELDARSVYRGIADYLTGFDLDAKALKRLTEAQKALADTHAADDPTLLRYENALLDLFAEIGALYRPRTEGESTYGSEEQGGNTQEYFLAFLQWLDPERAGLPQKYRDRLAHALSRYGIPDLSRRSELEGAMLWLFRSFARVPAVAPFITTILQRRLAQADVLAGSADRLDRQRLDRLAAATQGRQNSVADLARDLLFALFDEPVLAASTADLMTEMHGHLVALRAAPDAIDRNDRVDRLVWCPQPVRGILLEAWLESAPAEAEFRSALLEVYTRRYYRIRRMHGLDQGTVGGQLLAFGNYERPDGQFHVVIGYTALDDLPAWSAAVREHLASVPPERQVIVDAVTWSKAERLPIEELDAKLRDLLASCDFGRPLRRLDVTSTCLVGDAPEPERTQHLTYRQSGPDTPFEEDLLYRNLHPMLGKRLDLWRLSNFALERLPSAEDVYLFHGVAHDNPKDRRLFALGEVRDLVRVPHEDGTVHYPGLTRIGLLSLAAMRNALAKYPPRERPTANRLVLSVRPVWDIPGEDWQPLARSYEALARGASLERVVLHVNMPGKDASGAPLLEERVVYLDGIGKGLLSIRLGEPGPNPIRPLTRYAQKVLTSERFGVPYPYEIIRMLTPHEYDASRFPPGTFVELDLDDSGERLLAVDREPGHNTAHIVVGLLTNASPVVPEGVTRVALLSDPTQGLGNLAEPECRRINAALAYAAEHKLPVEWYAVSSGALIAMDSGTENMDWIALTLRRIIEFTQGGGEINIIVTGINVGGQPYWNAEATMLMHTKGILVMTPASTMVLTGKQALDFSGAVSADDNYGIGGYDRVMGPNGQGQYWAPSFAEACELLLRHYDYAYVVPGERFPRRRPTDDAAERDVRKAAHERTGGSTFTTVGEVFSAKTNPDRKQPFDMRSVMRAVTDTDCVPLERWKAWVDSDTSIVWDATIGGIPVCLLGLESHTVQRKGFVPSYGPPAWTSGTLFPQSSRKTARAINACSGNRPLVVLANLSGFDGSPESMRNWQLEYGAEIGRAITNFDGPIVFVVVSRYHGGAFVVFSKALTESMEIAAVEGSYASVIGGAPAAATVFARETKVRTESDPRVVAAREAVAAARGPEAASAREALAEITAQVRSEKLGEVADEFDGVHTIDRALEVGSVDAIIPAERLRPYIIDALERGMRPFLQAHVPMPRERTPEDQVEPQRT